MFRSFKEKHGNFFSTIYGICFYIGGIIGVLNWLRAIFDSIRSGDFVTFVVSIILQAVVIGVIAVVVGLVWGTFFSVLLFIPYLVIRGLRK